MREYGQVPADVAGPPLDDLAGTRAPVPPDDDVTREEHHE